MPAPILGVIGWWVALASKLAARLVVIAAGANAVIWTQILGEFAHKTAH